MDENKENLEELKGWNTFEEKLSKVHLSDTMIYQINGNQMRLLNLSDSSAIHLFKE